MSSTRARPFIRDAPPGSGKGAAKPKKPHVSAEGRQRLSELAKARHQAGGFQKSGDGLPTRQSRRKPKPSRERVAQMVAQAALEKKNADAIIEVFKDGIAQHQPITVRLKAAEAWLGIEREEAKQALREQDVDSQKRDRGELLQVLSEGLTSGYGALMLRKQIEASRGEDEIIEGHVVGEE